MQACLSVEEELRALGSKCIAGETQTPFSSYALVGYKRFNRGVAPWGGYQDISALVED
jgi:hypothetical protein